MVSYSRETINEFIENGKISSNTHEKGQILQDLVCYLFEKIPGIKVYETNIMNYYSTEELDIVLWNEQEMDGLRGFHSVIIIECKNLDQTMGTRDVSFFITKIRNKGLNFGIIVASNGITGSEDTSSRAHFEIPLALKEGIRVITINLREVLELTDSSDLIKLIKGKICKLYVKGSIEI